MRLLLDTHTFLWWTANDARLSQKAEAAVANASSEVFVSTVNGWEIAIKARLGKLPLPEAPDLFMARMVQRHAFGVLPVSLAHAVHEYHLPAHHSDPFDRLLVAQAQLEKLILVSDDALIGQYAVDTLW
ncbi:type II toxin-antitoxin system VapC family toxin [soil metagenome]